MTLDDDLFGTRARDNQVKKLSNRKADKEGHCADVVSDAIFRIVLGLRFSRRGESQEDNVNKLLDSLLSGLGQVSVSGLVLTADRGYAKMKLMKRLMGLGIGSMFIFPEHLLRCHPFVGQSFLNVGRLDDDESDDDRGADTDESSEHSGLDDNDEIIADEIPSDKPV